MQIPTTHSRISSIDILRGIIIVLMGLDHVRDFVALTSFAPEDISQTSPGWFFTRWITHYCAPVFVFLAGISAFIYGQKVSKAQLSKFLLTRGLWLIVMEFTLVHFGWTLSFGGFYFVQVIWVIGISMIILSALIHTPLWVITSFTVVLIGLHNTLDTVTINEYWWQLLHQQRWAPPLAVAYPLIPWPAVMTFGYLIGIVYMYNVDERKKYLISGGLIIIAAFILLRSLDAYGDADHWANQERGPVYTLLDFLNTTKYPPSLLYLCMTLGPALLLLAFFERFQGGVTRFFEVFGRVPFFFYIMHLFVGQGLAALYLGIRYGQWHSLLFVDPANWPPDYTPSLLVTYLVWIGLVIAMYFLCRWFGQVKRTYPYWWLKYL